MKNEEKLFEIIGEVDEGLVPDNTPRKKNNLLKFTAIGGGVCAAALIGVVALHSALVEKPPVSDYPSTSDSSVSVDNESSTPVQSSAPVQEQSSTPEQGNTESTPTESTVTPEHSGDILPIYSEVTYERTDGQEILSPTMEVGGMGFEGYMAFDISELDDSNPWSAEMEISTLPVFRNSSYTVGMGGMGIYLTEEEMLRMATAVADAMGTPVVSTEVEYVSDVIRNLPPEMQIDGVYCFSAVCDGSALGAETVEMDIYGDGSIRIMFGEGLPLPDGYSMTYHDTTDEQAEKTLAYLKEKFSRLIPFESYVNSTGGDYNIHAQQYRSYEFLDVTGDTPEEQIVSYNFRSVMFAPDDEGELMVIWLENPLCCAEYMGDYPIITAEKAQEMLLDGKFITTVPIDYATDGKITENAIAKVELIYRTGNDACYLPYYRFYVELSDDWHGEWAEGMKDFGAFYVPAISEEYLTDVTLWNGSFN